MSPHPPEWVLGRHATIFHSTRKKGSFCHNYYYFILFLKSTSTTSSSGLGSITPIEDDRNGKPAAPESCLYLFMEKHPSYYLVCFFFLPPIDERCRPRFSIPIVSLANASSVVVAHFFLHSQFFDCWYARRARSPGYLKGFVLA